MKYKDFLSFNEFKESFYELIKLELYVIWKYVTERNEGAKFVINSRVSLLKNPVTSDNYEYFINNLTADCEMLLSESVYRIDSNSFISEMFERIKLFTADHLYLRYNSEEAAPLWCKFGCFSYDPAPDDAIFLHIGNTLIPDSILNNKEYMINSLISLLNDAEKKHSSRIITTETWLNSYGKWLSILPKEWLDNMQYSSNDILWHYGFWGQFINRKGCINKKTADYYLKNSALMYPVKKSSCTIKTLKEHLQSLLHK